MYLRVSLTDRCNLRCRYCLPADARFAPERASSEELMHLTEVVWAEAGVNKIRFTGGEPTLAPRLADHVRHARRLVGGAIGLTSNGVHLRQQLAELRAAGLRKLNISIDAVEREAFARITRRDELDAVLDSIHAAKALGFTPLKINAVAMPETDYAGLLTFAIEHGVHLRFIELMAIGVSRGEHQQRRILAPAIRERLFDAGFSLSEAQDRDEPTSRVWRVLGVDPEHSSLGFITTNSEPFCATCDRLRLTAQGHLHNCLFDQRGTDLLTPLRAGDRQTVIKRIHQHVGAKRAPEHFIRAHNMAAIGG